MTTRLRRLNDDGIAHFGAYLIAQKNGASQEPPFGLLDDPHYSEELAFVVNLESQSFASRYDIGEYLMKVLANMDRRLIAYDYMMWSWLGLYFFDDISPLMDGVRKVLQEAVYILAASFNHQRYYRHAVRSAWQMVLDHGSFAKVLLTTKATRSEVAEQLGSVQSIIGKRTSGRLFCTRKGTPLGRRNVNRNLYGTLKKLGIPKGGPHAFRHGRVSVLAATGVPQRLQEEWVGHSSYRITERYTHFDDSYRQKMVSESALFVADGPNGPNSEGVLQPVGVAA